MKVKLDYNGLIRQIEETIDADNIEYLESNALYVDVGLQLLEGYMREIAEHAIETQDPWLIEWCKNLMIIKVINE